MSPQQVLIAVAIAAGAAVIAIIALVVSKGKKGNALTGLALALVLAGLIFGKSQVVGYGLLGVGVILAVIDLIRKLRSRAADRSCP